jgi:hypothetical protein
MTLITPRKEEEGRPARDGSLHMGYAAQREFGPGPTDEKTGRKLHK